MEIVKTNNWTIRTLDGTSDALVEELVVPADGLKVCTLVFDDASLNSTALLATENAAFEHMVVYVATGKATPNIAVRSHHSAKNSGAKMLVRGVATGTARVDFKGSIDIAPGAQETDAELRHAGMLLSEHAKIAALPGFEIHSNDVKAAHSSAVYYIRPEQLFYLQSRGIDEQKARQMIVEGFLYELLPEELDDAQRANIEQMIIQRIDVQ